jgi:hypothetical protein
VKDLTVGVSKIPPPCQKLSLDTIFFLMFRLLVGTA